ncbi:MAG: DUF2325 domain-containing protein [Candidatus Accumulibacter sp. UW26]|jgi:hypothetical protein
MPDSDRWAERLSPPCRSPLPGVIPAPAGPGQQLPIEEPGGLATGSRRRKLWDLSHKFHCPLVGVCFAVDDLRALMSRVMFFTAGASDFELHTTAVGTCESRSRLSELLHKTLEKRFHLHVRRFAAARDAAALQELWREFSATGSDLPGALWASWTHPSCGALLAEQIYADIHMIQHQVGCGRRADLATLKALQAENARLRGQLVELRCESETQRSERLRETQGLAQELARLRADLVICQAGCISHNAYWRVKEQCKRTGKPCVFVRGAGVTSFGRVVGAACGSSGETGDLTDDTDPAACDLKHHS